MEENRDNSKAAAQLAADSEIVANCLAAGTRVPETVAARVRERASRARAQILASRGIEDIGVQIIRDIRGELPRS